MNIYVGNVPFQMTEADLNDLFAEYGSVTSCKLIIDRETGRSKGFAFVEVEDDNDARKAIEELNDKEVNGRNLRINEARPRR